MVAWGEALVQHGGPSAQAGLSSASSDSFTCSSSAPGHAKEPALADGLDARAGPQPGAGRPSAAQALLLAVHGASEALLGGGQSALQSRFKNLDSLVI